jgi:hypothetical protein
MAYSFESPDQPWPAHELESLQLWASITPSKIAEVDALPAILGRVINCRKDTTISYAGLYFVGIDEMVLYRPRLDVFVHESVHAFHSPYILPQRYEESFTRAIEVEIFSHLTQPHPWDESHSYYYDVYYEIYNQPTMAGPWTEFFLLARYQLGGYAAAKLMFERIDFFKAFFGAHYLAQRSLNETGITEAQVANMICSIVDSVEGQSTRDWLQWQYVWRLDCREGRQIWQSPVPRFFGFFERTGEQEEVIPNVPYQARVLGAGGVLLSVSGVTDQNGFADIQDTTGALSGYYGTTAIVVDGIGLSDTAFTVLFNDTTLTNLGVFGYVKGLNSGRVFARSIDDPTVWGEAEVMNGAFVIESLMPFRGRFALTFTSSDGEVVVTRRFNKDRADYCVVVDTNSRPTSVEAARPISPEAFSLAQNYPNPFNPSTTVQFTLSRPGEVTLAIYDVLGRQVTMLVSGWHPVGSFSKTWDAANYANGVYYYRLRVGKIAETKKMLLQK